MKNFLIGGVAAILTLVPTSVIAQSVAFTEADGCDRVTVNNTVCHTRLKDGARVVEMQALRGDYFDGFDYYRVGIIQSTEGFIIYVNTIYGNLAAALVDSDTGEYVTTQGDVDILPYFSDEIMILVEEYYAY